MKKFISMSIAFATLFVVAVVFIRKFDVIKESFLENKFYFLLIAGVYIISRLLDGVRLNIMASFFGISLKSFEYLGLAMVMPLYNLIFPNAGLITNALYLKSKHNLKFRHFISVSLLRFVTTIALCGITGVVASIIYMVGEKSLVLLWPVTVYVALLGISVTLFVVPLPRIAIFKRYQLFSKVSEAINKFNEIKSDKRLIVSLVFIQLAISLAVISRYYIVLRALSIDAPLVGILAITPLTVLSNLINLIPSNLAIREAVVSGGLILIGYTIEEGLLVAAIDRVVLLATTLIMGTWFFIRLRYSTNLITSNEIVVEQRAND